MDKRIVNMLCLSAIGSFLLGCSVNGVHIQVPEDIRQPIIFGNVPGIQNSKWPESAKKTGDFKALAFDYHGVSSGNSSHNSLKKHLDESFYNQDHLFIKNFQFTLNSSQGFASSSSEFKMTGELMELATDPISTQGQAK